MDLWSKARSFAEEAAKRSTELTKEAMSRSQELTSTIGTSKLSDIVNETAKKSKELAAEVKAEALKRADQIKAISIQEKVNLVNVLEREWSRGGGGVDKEGGGVNDDNDKELERFGVCEELREFVKGITLNTFQDFPLEDDDTVSDVPTVSNVRQDLTEWQARHATLVLSTVKEISKLRYELCPRIMKERKFWRIYFILVNSHVTPYEKKYMEEKLKSAEQEKEGKVKETTKESTVSKPDIAEPSQPLKKATSSAEQDLDVFLLGDLGDSDDGADDGGGAFDDDDDFDKIGDSSEDERAKESKK